jgi:hypothetical protein
MASSNRLVITAALYPINFMYQFDAGVRSCIHLNSKDKVDPDSVLMFMLENCKVYHRQLQCQL